MDGAIPIESFLAADIGSTVTHACLIDRVDGVYRLIARAEAPTTLTPPEEDLTLGLRRAIARVAAIAQRPLLDEVGEIIVPEQDTGTGVDAFVATCNAASPLRCALVGLSRDLSVASAHKVCATANVEIVREVALGSLMRHQQVAALATLGEALLDLILLVGGIDAGPTDSLASAARVLALALDRVPAAQRPVVVFAGNQEARRPIAAILGQETDYRVVDNVRPSLEQESPDELHRELALIYAQHKLAALPGYARLTRWATVPVQATAEALGTALRFIAQRNALPQGLVCVDVGGASTLVSLCRDGVYRAATSAALGTGGGARRVLALSGLADVRRWLPVALSEQATYVQIENAGLRPQGVPQTLADAHLTQALARQALHLTLRSFLAQAGAAPGDRLPVVDLIAARGGALAHAPSDAIAALTLLDGLQPGGLTRLVLDWASLWPQLGAIAPVAPLAASQVLERDSFRELGIVIAPIGTVPSDGVALHLSLLREEGPPIEAEIPGGVVRRFPLGLHERATLEIRPAPDLDIGLGRPGQGGRAQVRGGSLGIIVDTRGRPLALPENADERSERCAEWLANLSS